MRLQVGAPALRCATYVLKTKFVKRGWREYPKYSVNGGMKLGNILRKVADFGFLLTAVNRGCGIAGSAQWPYGQATASVLSAAVIPDNE